VWQWQRGYLPAFCVRVLVRRHAKQGGVSNSISGQFHVLREHFRAVTYNESYPAPPQNIIRMVRWRVAFVHVCSPSACLPGAMHQVFNAVVCLFVRGITQVKTNRFIPLVVHANQADTIDAAIRFKRHADCDMIIAGAAEAHLLADRLVANSTWCLVLCTATPMLA